MTPFNTYTWARKKSASRLDSHIVSLDFKTQDGQTVKIENLQQEIEILIPHKSQKRNSESNHIINPGDNSTLIYYKFYVAHDKSAFHIEIKPNLEETFTVYLRYGSRPTVDSYDAIRNVPDFSSCVEPGNCSRVLSFLDCHNLSSTWDGVYSSQICKDIPYLRKSSYNTINNTNNTCDSLISFLECSDQCSGSCFGGKCDFENCNGGNLSRPVCKNKDTFLRCNGIHDEISYKSCQRELWPHLFYGKYQKCHQNPYKYFFGWPVFNKAGFYYLGIRYQDKTHDETHQEHSLSTLDTPSVNLLRRKKKSIINLPFRNKSSTPVRRCVPVVVKPPPTPQPQPPTPPPAIFTTIIKRDKKIFLLELNN